MIRRLFYRGRHRAGQFSLTVDAIQEHLRQNPWRLDHHGNLVWPVRVRLYGSGGGGGARISAAPFNGSWSIPVLQNPVWPDGAPVGVAL